MQHPTPAAQPTKAAGEQQPATAVAKPNDAATKAPAEPPAGKSDTLVYATNISDVITLDPAQMYAWTGILTPQQYLSGFGQV